MGLLFWPLKGGIENYEINIAQSRDVCVVQRQKR